MNEKKILETRCDNKCELCESQDDLIIYNIPPYSIKDVDKCVMVCNQCHDKLENFSYEDTEYWACLKKTMWTQIPSVQALIYRILSKFKSENWAQGLLDMLYLDEDTLKIALQNDGDDTINQTIRHVDSNGVELHSGDTVIINKDLKVKGSNLVAKRGTAVRGIHLVLDNPEQIEGKVEGQQIVILTKFVSKSS